MDEESVDNGVPTVGDQLRAARKRKKMSLEDIAARTRIPLRHLESIEASDWASLPAPTYTVGFAKSYAGVVDLDRTEIGQQLRTEMGDPRSMPVAEPEVFEPADPARAMPRALVIGAILAVLVLVGIMSWLNKRSLADGSDAQANQAATVQAPAQPPPLVVPAPQGPVVLSASAPVWIAVYDKSGASYYSGMLSPGKDFTVPAGAAAPLLKTGKPESIKIMVGTAIAAAVGPPGQKVSDVSLLPADLLKPDSSGASPPPAATVARPQAAAPAQRRTIAPVRRPARPRAAAPAPAPAPATPPPPANTTG